MELTPATRAVLRLAFVVLALALFASVWELAARQAPGSALYLGVLPGPIASLRETATVVGLVSLGVAWLVPAAARNGARGREPRGLVLAMAAGVALGLLASIYAAAAGMHGVQLGDLRPAAFPVFVVKHGGLGLWAVCVGELARRALFRRARLRP